MKNHRLLFTIIIVPIIVSASYFYGLVKGKSIAESVYLSELIKRKDEYEKEIKLKEKLHEELTLQNTINLQQAKREYDETITNIVSDYNGRLLNSEKRALYYREQAKDSSSECRAIASHAAQLDRTVEEGRQLVRELKSTVRLYESQLVSLGEQLKNDREMINK